MWRPSRPISCSPSSRRRPHNDTDLPIYGIPSVLFRYRVDGSFMELRAREQLLGKLVHAKPPPHSQQPHTHRLHLLLRLQLGQRHPHPPCAPLTRGNRDLPRPRSRTGVQDGGSPDRRRFSQAPVPPGAATPAPRSPRRTQFSQYSPTDDPHSEIRRNPCKVRRGR